TTVFHIQQILKGYQVIARDVTGSKEDRARNYSSAVNSDDVEFVSDEDLPEDKQWIQATKKEMRDFPLSDHDDIVDASGDAYNESYERMVTGLVVRNYKPQRNLVNWSDFAARFPFYADGQLALKIPANFTVYAGIKIQEATRPTSAVI